MYVLVDVWDDDSRILLREADEQTAARLQGSEPQPHA